MLQTFSRSKIMPRGRGAEVGFSDDLPRRDALLRIWPRTLSFDIKIFIFLNAKLLLLWYGHSSML